MPRSWIKSWRTGSRCLEKRHSALVGGSKPGEERLQAWCSLERRKRDGASLVKTIIPGEVTLRAWRKTEAWRSDTTS